MGNSLIKLNSLINCSFNYTLWKKKRDNLVKYNILVRAITRENKI